MKTWHWMVSIPMIAIGLKVADRAIAIGLDGRTMYHRHISGPDNNSLCTTPYSVRFWAYIRGMSTREYKCPSNPSRIVSEKVIRLRWYHTPFPTAN